MKPYHDLHLLPYIVADTVCQQPYTGSEWSWHLRNPHNVAKTEQLRQAMTPEQQREFCQLVDQRCRAAYVARADWFKRCLHGTSGRDQLYIWVSHWLAAYLANPASCRT